MSKLFDIKGYFDSSYEYQFNDRDMWEGKILLEDDGWFEGVVKDVSSSYQEDRFVFGVYHPSKVIELFKWTPTSYSSPFVFHGKNNDDDGYEGEFEVIESFGSRPFGISRILTEEKVLGKDEEQVEVDDVKRRIERYKVFFMDDIGKSFYDSISSMRSGMCKVFLKYYEGGLTQEEKNSIMGECCPANDRGMEPAKEFVIKITPNMFSPADADDNELPF